MHLQTALPTQHHSTWELLPTNGGEQLSHNLLSTIPLTPRGHVFAQSLFFCFNELKSVLPAGFHNPPLDIWGRGRGIWWRKIEGRVKPEGPEGYPCLWGISYQLYKVNPMGYRQETLMQGSISAVCWRLGGRDLKSHKKNFWTQHWESVFPTLVTWTPVSTEQNTPWQSWQCDGLTHCEWFSMSWCCLMI